VKIVRERKVERWKGEVQCLSDDGGNLYINCTCLPLRFYFLLNSIKKRIDFVILVLKTWSRPF